MIRQDVLDFAEAMESKLRKYDATRGTSWKTDRPKDLLEHLKEEVRELEVGLECKDDIERILLECADVANLAMMIADSYSLNLWKKDDEEYERRNIR
jgi:hypothetical protein